MTCVLFRERCIVVCPALSGDIKVILQDDLCGDGVDVLAGAARVVTTGVQAFFRFERGETLLGVGDR